MTEITYLRGDATDPVGEGSKIIVHICNDIGAWGAGFVMSLSKKWKKPEESYHRLFRLYQSCGEQVPLGAVGFVSVEKDIWVANLIGQHGIRSSRNPTPIRYEAVEEGLEEVSEFAQEFPPTSIHMPRIGCGLAGGSWDRIEPLIQKTLCDYGLDVFVYDL